VRRLKTAAAPAPPAELSEEQLETWAEVLGRVATALFLATGSLDGITDCARQARFPRIGDERPPWEVRGWMLPHVMDVLPAETGIGRGRWWYWLETMLEGRLLDGPIPPVSYTSAAPAGQKAVMKAAELIGSREGFSSAPGLLIDWLAWALHVSKEPPRLQTETQEALYRGFSIDPLLEVPSDYLGWLMCEYKGRSYDPQGFFPTPLEVCEMMALMNFAGGDSARDDRLLTVHDPCVGTGRMLLVAGNRSLRLYGQDINARCCAATLINGALYCPWLAFPFPESFFPAREHPDVVAGLHLRTEPAGARPRGTGRSARRTRRTAGALRWALTSPTSTGRRSSVARPS
jgi:hypothetical protein